MTHLNKVFYLQGEEGMPRLHRYFQGPPFPICLDHVRIASRPKAKQKWVSKILENSQVKELLQNVCKADMFAIRIGLTAGYKEWKREPMDMIIMYIKEMLKPCPILEEISQRPM
jgi:hypothetical protein